MQAPTIQLPDVFNAAVEFVDRHIAEGRADRSPCVMRAARSPMVRWQRWSIGWGTPCAA